MNVPVGLMLYSLVVLALAPAQLQALTRGGMTPRLGIAAWVTTVASVLAVWLASGAIMIAHVARRWNHPTWLAPCRVLLHSLAAGGTLCRTVLAVLAVLGVVAVTVTAVRFGRTLARMRARTHEHAQAVRVVGHRVGVFGAGACPSQNVEMVVLDAAEPAAYCVAGRPHAIVLTRGALARLDDQQLAAVLAHERAHVTGHHAQLVAVLRGLAVVFPRVGLFAAAAQEVSRLLEMCADDSAARQHGPAPLLAGLLALALATPAPAGALAASGVAVVDRANRLAADSPDRDRTRARAALVAAITMIGAGPLLTIALAGFGPLLCAM